MPDLPPTEKNHFDDAMYTAGIEALHVVQDYLKNFPTKQTNSVERDKANIALKLIAVVNSAPSPNNI